MHALIEKTTAYGARLRSGIDTIEYHTWHRTPYGKVTKTQENITHK